MHQSGTTQGHHEGRLLDARAASMIAASIALVAPAGITLLLRSSTLSVPAILWWVQFEPSRVVVDWGPAWWWSIFPLTFPRLIFPYQMFRYYRGKSTGATTLLVILLTELPLCIAASILTAIGTWGPSITAPTPFMFLSAVIMIWRWPYSKRGWPLT